MEAVIMALATFPEAKIEERRRFSQTEGPSIYDVRKILVFLDPPVSAFGTDLQY